MAIYSTDDLTALSGPHVARAWFGEFDLPSGYQRLHSGVGRVPAGGYEWRGVSDPIGGQMVGVSLIEDPRFGQAAKIDITIGGVNAAFFKSIKDDARAIEGRSAKIWFGMFDPETESLIMFKPTFPRGYMSAPTLRREGIGLRQIGLTIEGIWQAQNYPFGGKWTAAGQKLRYPGDEGLNFAGLKVTEQWI